MSQLHTHTQAHMVQACFPTNAISGWRLAVKLLKPQGDLAAWVGLVRSGREPLNWGVSYLPSEVKSPSVVESPPVIECK